MVSIPGLDLLSTGVDVAVAVQWVKSGLYGADLIVRRADDLVRHLRSLPRKEFYEFVRRWKYARQLVSLQIRLWIEQVFTDAGGHWEQLVTGFKSVRDVKFRITAQNRTNAYKKGTRYDKPPSGFEGRISSGRRGK